MTAMSKQQLRSELTARLSRLSEREKDTKSSNICSTLVSSINWSKISTVHCYQTMTHLFEVDTRPLIDYIQSSHPHVSLDLVEDSKEAVQPTAQYDLIIVPLLGYDTDGNRLGRGAGWYDMFLASQPHARKVGLAFNEQLCPLIPTEQHDIKLDRIVSA